MLEIERKFLVKTPPADLARYPKTSIIQGYLAVEPGRCQVRLRRQRDENYLSPEYYLTVKLREGMVREEVNLSLSQENFDRLWPLTVGRRLDKTRYQIPYQGRTIELDIFHGTLDGLILAEVEFPDESQCRDFVSPAWLGEDVTLDPAYKNTRLACG
jgi:CYTH domain-containing protein